ncbi:hypothetical protein BDZ89DRAFT_1042081 [Hymenopellis radicata]|nr:hypothetical protein BDZ89DRAFT_1042081 [Hymenopellis radicata]
MVTHLVLQGSKKKGLNTALVLGHRHAQPTCIELQDVINCYVQRAFSFSRFHLSYTLFVLFFYYYCKDYYALRSTFISPQRNRVFRVHFAITRLVVLKLLKAGAIHAIVAARLTGLFGPVPQELLDLVIFHLADDRTTLLSCALVHSTWTSISRYHLRPLILVVSSSSRATELLNLLCSSRETLSLSITGIALVGNPPVNDIITSAKLICARSLYSKLLHVLKAKHITLCSGIVENDPLLVRTLAQYFPGLTDLRVTCASWLDITSFMRALAGSFPRLAKLCIELGSGGLALPEASLSGELRVLKLDMPCLRSLRVVGWNNELMRCLRDSIVGTLERLEMESANVWSTCRVEEATLLIQRNKETLRDVRLSFLKTDVAFDLSGLMCLENLEVTRGMSDMEVLEGWRLPRSLKRLYTRILVGAWDCTGIGRVSTEGDVLLEGEELERALRMY